MSSVASRFKTSDVKTANRDLGYLHPVMRAAVVEVEGLCQNELMPFRMFEAFRTPQRQRHLWLQGRIQSRPGRVLTQAGAWESFHQFGLAADFVLVLDHEWVFDSMENSHLWLRLREIGEIYGLEAHDAACRDGHLQLATFELGDLRKSIYPGGGDRSWEENLRHAIESYPLERATSSLPRSLTAASGPASPARSGSSRNP